MTRSKSRAFLSVPNDLLTYSFTGIVCPILSATFVLVLLPAADEVCELSGPELDDLRSRMDEIRAVPHLVH